MRILRGGILNFAKSPKIRNSRKFKHTKITRSTVLLIVFKWWPIFVIYLNYVPNLNMILCQPLLYTGSIAICLVTSSCPADEENVSTKDIPIII